MYFDPDGGPDGGGSLVTPGATGDSASTTDIRCCPLDPSSPDFPLLEGCAITFDDSQVNQVIISVDPAQLAGSCLTVGDDECSLNLNLTECLTSTCLTIGANSIDLNVAALAGKHLDANGCALDVNLQDCLVDTDDLAGDGLEGSPGCEIEVKTGCGIKIDAAAAVAVDVEALAGDGLVGGAVGCELEVDPGCGLTLTGGKVAVNRLDLIADSIYMKTTGGNCSIDPITEPLPVMVDITDLILSTAGTTLTVSFTAHYEMIRVIALEGASTQGFLSSVTGTAC